MSENIQDHFESLHSNILSGDDLLNCIRGMPALLFRIEMVKSRIEYLNDFQVEGLGSKTFLLLKNKKLSREIILEEDYPNYEEFIQSAHNAVNITSIIRVRTDSGQIRWIKLLGGANPFNPGFYLGVLMDMTPSVSLVNEMNEKEEEKLAMVEMLDNPVILIDMATMAVISHNSAAHELFGYSFDDFRKLKFRDLYHQAFSSDMNRILEEVVFDKKWEGKIFFQRKGQSRFLCQTSLRSSRIKEKKLLRISIHSVDSTDELSRNGKLSEESRALSNDGKEYVQMLTEKISQASDMGNILELILHNPFPGAEKFNGIIYSDILLNKEKVVVYAAGKPFAKLKSGETFSYEGTIAENIEQYKLDHLILDDTMSSIKAIDWALFIPYGIRSYFAKPFYERNSLRTVLILCSTSTNAFSEDEIRNYELLYTPFLKGLKNWRKAMRKKKSER